MATATTNRNKVIIKEEADVEKRTREQTSMDINQRGKCRNEKRDETIYLYKGAIAL